jgi:hypothetical protein
VRLLLDTHVLLWRMHGSPMLGTEASERVDAADELVISAISFLEIGVKVATGKLRMPAGLREYVLESVRPAADLPSAQRGADDRDGGQAFRPLRRAGRPGGRVSIR